MDAEQMDLVRGLFAEITGKAETLHDLSVSGHVECKLAQDFVDLAQRIIKVALTISMLAAAVTALADEEGVQSPGEDDDERFDASSS